jgi:hypothetical protein
VATLDVGMRMRDVQLAARHADLEQPPFTTGAAGTSTALRRYRMSKVVVRLPVRFATAGEERQIGTVVCVRDFRRFPAWSADVDELDLCWAGAECP